MKGKKQYRSILYLDLLVMNGRSWASQVIDLVHLEQDRQNNVVPNHLEVWLPYQMLDVLLGPRKEVIETDHLFIFIFQKEEVTRE